MVYWSGAGSGCRVDDYHLHIGPDQEEHEEEDQQAYAAVQRRCALVCHARICVAKYCIDFSFEPRLVNRDTQNIRRITYAQFRIQSYSSVHMYLPWNLSCLLSLYVRYRVSLIALLPNTRTAISCLERWVSQQRGLRLDRPSHPANFFDDPDPVDYLELAKLSARNFDARWPKIKDDFERESTPGTSPLPLSSYAG